MARIPEDELARLKQDVAIARLAAARGISLKPSGNNLLGLCPFHDDHEPSLVITPDKNLWHCLGACQQGGSVIDWVMKSEGVSFRHAVELLRERLQVPRSRRQAPRPPREAHAHSQAPPLLLPTAADQELLQQYQRPLRTHTRDGQTVHYIAVTREDIMVANRLAHDVLGRSLDDLAPQTRRLLGLIHQMVSEQCQQRGIDRADYRFSRKAVREYTGWNVTQTRVHLDRLVNLEYVLVHRGSRGQSCVYELLYNGEGQAGQGFLMGLIDPAQLPSVPTTASWTSLGLRPSGVQGLASKSDHKRVVHFLTGG